MKLKVKLLFLMVGPVVSSLANEPSPYAGYCALLDDVLIRAMDHPSIRTAAVSILERVAEGRAGEVSAESEFEVGLSKGMLQRKEFGVSTVRVCALRKLGETALPDVLLFLESLKQPDFAGDTTQQIWPAAQIALREARLRGIADVQSQFDFLESTITEPHDAMSNSAVQSWAVNQLCDRGVLTAMAIIQKSIRNRLSGQSGEDEIQFCETRIQVVRRNPDRIKALGSVLNVSGTEGRRLQLWAIYQLDSMRSLEADAELDRFAGEIGRLPERSLERQRLALAEGIIRNIRDDRRLRAK